MIGHNTLKWALGDGSNLLFGNLEKALPELLWPTVEEGIKRIRKVGMLEWVFCRDWKTHEMMILQKT